MIQTANNPAVSVKDLRKNYDAVEATRGVSFDIMPVKSLDLSVTTARASQH
ncbi:hypothetical protein HB774_32770 (plasmid) [Rhizobium leguminosarum bv. viciae]|nr:hypothetical protein HB774_32770 [Rhizobium leguminosarum bv. viciae]